MSMSPSYLTTLPTEILEQLLLHLPGQDIVKMEAVSRHFQDLVRNSPTLQHQLELFAISLVDNPCYPCGFAERRKRCNDYAHKLSNAANIVESTHRLPPNQSSGWGRAKYFGNGLIVSNSLEDNSLAFLRIPSVASRKSIEGWSIPPTTFEILGCSVYPPGNVIAVVEQKENFIHIHFLNLWDGSPYCASPSNLIMWEFPPRVDPIINEQIAITGSRVAMCVYYRDEGLPGDEMVRKILVWDWKTRGLVLDLSSTRRGEPVKQNARVIFLDEFRMVVAPDERIITELVVFDTLIPQGHPGNLRQFRFPPEFRDRRARIFIDHDRDLGTPNRDEALIADPAQAVLTMQFGEHWEHHHLLVVRTQVLTEQTYLVGTDPHICWDEWREDTVVMEVPVYGSSPTFVHGARVVVVGIHFFGWDQYHIVHTFNFGRCSSLPLRGGAGGTERRVLFEDGANFEFELGDSMRDELLSLSDGSLFCLGMPGDGGNSDGTLQAWEFL